MHVKHYHFPFEMLTTWSEFLDATAIFMGVVFIVWVLASLYYWTTQDLRHPIHDLGLGNKKRKLDHKRVRHSDAPKNDKDLT